METIIRTWPGIVKKGFTVLNSHSLKQLKEPVPHHLFIYVTGLKPDLFRINNLLIATSQMPSKI